MSVELFCQLVINGLALGLIYVLVASGLILVLGIARVFNFAHGEFYMFGAFTVYYVMAGAHLNFIIGLIAALIVGALLGAIGYKAVFHYMRGDLLRCAAASIGIGLILKQVALLLFGSSNYGIARFFEGMIEIGGIRLSEGKLLVILLALLVVTGLYYLLFKTKTGKAMRAVSLDAKTASLLGINTVYIYLITLIMGSGLAALAGGIVAPLFMISTEIGSVMLLMVFTVLIIGGIESLPGAVVAGIILGQLQSFGYHFFTGDAELFLYCCVGIFLIFRPGGIFGAIVKEIY